MLAVLGIDATAEMVYREMLAHPQEGVTELVRRLELTEQEVRGALDTSKREERPPCCPWNKPRSAGQVNGGG